MRKITTDFTGVYYEDEKGQVFFKGYGDRHFVRLTIQEEESVRLHVRNE